MTVNQPYTDSTKMRSLLDMYLEADKAYCDVIYRNDHTEKEADQAQYAVFRTAGHVAHFLNELILREQIVILDMPIDAYKTDDVDPEYHAFLRDERRKAEEERKSNPPGKDRLLAGTYIPGRDGKYHVSDGNGGTLCGELLSDDAKPPYETCQRCQNVR